MELRALLLDTPVPQLCQSKVDDTYRAVNQVAQDILWADVIVFDTELVQELEGEENTLPAEVASGSWTWDFLARHAHRQRSLCLKLTKASPAASSTRE